MFSIRVAVVSFGRFGVISWIESLLAEDDPPNHTNGHELPPISEL
jgi:hypothetical protein